MMWGIHDIGDEKLELLIKDSESPQVLQTLADLSRKHFGFFNKTISRSLEYPYIVNKIGDIHGKRVLDIGAGVSPLPLYLALQGASVVTVDNSALVRQLTCDTHSWNGWGFLDYRGLHNDISSINSDICETEFSAETFDCVYSVSVVEHMPSHSRRDMWNRMSHWVKESGILVLTLDLIPNTELLWNFCEGKLVEESEVHGDTKEVQDELSELGFKLTECKIVHMPPESRTDIALLSFAKSNTKNKECN